jgi:drug/metabolite transporter (DMT)-like permease
MTSPTATDRQWAMGVAAAACAACIWSSWTVVSKLAVSADIAPLDLAAVRFATSGIISIPVVFYLKPYKNISIPRIGALAASGGVPYVLLLYFGFAYAPASHGGVLVNGVVPALAMLFRSLSTSSRPTSRELGGVVSVIAGVCLVVTGTDKSVGAHGTGDLIFLCAACLFAAFIVLSAKWKCTPAQVLMSLSLTGFVLYLPCWWLWSPHAVLAVPYHALLLQILYQGVLAPVVGMLLISRASVLCGPITVATILSSVPALSTLLSATLLAEPVSALNWLGIGVGTVGLLLIILQNSANRGAPVTAREIGTR